MKGKESDDESKEEELNSLYYVGRSGLIWLAFPRSFMPSRPLGGVEIGALVRFEVVIFAVGLWMYLVPQPGMVRPAIGTLLFCTGAAWRYHL